MHVLGEEEGPDTWEGYYKNSLALKSWKVEIKSERGVGYFISADNGKFFKLSSILISNVLTKIKV